MSACKIHHRFTDLVLMVQCNVEFVVAYGIYIHYLIDLKNMFIKIKDVSSSNDDLLYPTSSSCKYLPLLMELQYLQNAD